MPSTRAAVLKENKLRPLKNHILTEQNLYYLNNSTVNKSVTWPFLSFDGHGQKFNYRYCPYFFTGLPLLLALWVTFYRTFD